MDEKQEKPAKNADKSKKLDIKITGLDLDKREYQEIVLSNSNFPDGDYSRQNQYD